YSDSSDIPEKEIALNKIKQPTAELLKKYTTTEIYYSKKNEIDSILQKRVINEFKDSKYNVKTSIIGYVNLPKETKILYDKFLKLEQSYLEVELEIHYRKKEIEQELKTNKNLTRV